METLINIVMVICFITSGFFLIANVTGGFFFKVVARIVGLLGTVLPIIYFLKYFQII